MASSITHNPYSIKKLLGLASYASVNMRVRPHYPHGSREHRDSPAHVHIQHSVLPPVRLPLVHNRVHSIRRRDADDSVADMDLGSGQSNRTHSCGRGRGLRGRVADSQ